MKPVLKVGKLYHILLIFVVTELVLCGSGQLIKVGGGLTLRMLNYLCIFGFYLLFIIYGHFKMDRQDWKIFGFYLLSFFFSASWCLINDNIQNLTEDIKPLSYFLVFPFFIIAIDSYATIRKISSIIQYGALVMGTVYLIYLAAIKILGLIDFVTFYGSMSEQSDIMFREEGGELFYKGFIFLPIGLLFWLKERKIFPICIILLAIYFTLTRGFYVIAMLGTAWYVISISKKNLPTLLFWGFCGMAAIFVVIASGLFEMGEARSDGDIIRIITFEQVMTNATPLSVLIGHGFGEGVPIRQIHMENAFLEIFHKQGLLGLSFWLFLLYNIYFYNKKVVVHKNISRLYWIGTLMVYIQSLFNPFLTNPIGMSFVIISYASCRYLSRPGQIIGRKLEFVPSVARTVNS